MYLALLQQAGSGKISPQIMQFIFIGGMFALMYFFLIRPQSKARKQMQERLAKLKAGDEVLLSSGLYATIDRIEDQVLFLKLGSSIVKARKTAVVAFAAEPAPEQN
jgi:preprotein translocase subunit YajC